MRRLKIGSTDLCLGEGLLETLLPEICLTLPGKKILVADEALQDSYAKKLSGRIEAPLLTIPSGKRAKTAFGLIESLVQLEADRETTLIALGGGATTDLVAFVASIYMRGIALLLLPTTLLAAVDAAIGGKTAIDLPHGKNLVGTFYPPKAIVIDCNTFGTLPEKEWLNGLAEILKMGLIADASIWEEALQNRRDAAFFFRAIQAKASIVEQDPFDRSLRRILNFGHTIGHGLEVLANYAIPHGEAVAIGSLVESHLSEHLGYLSREELEKIEKVYRSLPLRLPKEYTRSGLIEAMKRDKKGKMQFVLIDRIGHALDFGGRYCRPVTLTGLEPTLAWMEKEYGL